MEADEEDDMQEITTQTEWAAAERLRDAAERLAPCAPVRDLIGTTDVMAAYRVQAVNVDLRLTSGRRLVGRKIGLTSPAVQAQLGVGEPDFGCLLDDMQVPDGGIVQPGRLLQPKVEAEVAFHLGSDLDGPLGSADDLRSAVIGMAAAIEIVDSRISDWDITIADTVADNASSGLFVVSDLLVPLDGLDPAAVEMTLTCNGVEASSGTGRACLGSPLEALLWLARACQSVGAPLQAGELVLSGALGPMVPVAVGDTVAASISGLGEVSVSFD
jgi:2-keto-4-pentenoate hydratase